MESAWIDGLKASVIVCDRDGKILFLNATAVRQYAKDGGAGLVGKNLRDCHKAESSEKIARFIAEGKPNHYTITKNGRKRMIHQMPWFEGGRKPREGIPAGVGARRDSRTSEFEGGQCAGLVEFAMDIPEELPHFDRDQQNEVEES